MTRVASRAARPARHPADRFVFAPDERRSAVLDTIDSARDRLFLSLFRCDDFHVLDALAAALQRGVDVSVLLTPRAKGGAKRLGELWQVLEGMGANIRRYADPVVKYHAKYIVADNGPALVASLNFTRKCFTRTSDFLLLTHDPVVVGGLRRLFTGDCAGRGLSLPSKARRRLIVGPEEARRTLTDMLERGRKSIRIVDPKVTDPAILDLLKAKRAAGVAVEVLGRDGLRGFEAHGKMVLVDDSVGVLGSLSLSALSLDFRREVAVAVRDRASLNQMDQAFRMLAAPRAGARARALK